MFDALRGSQPLSQALFGVNTLSGILLGPAFRVTGLGSTSCHGQARVLVRRTPIYEDDGSGSAYYYGQYFMVSPDPYKDPFGFIFGGGTQRRNSPGLNPYSDQHPTFVDFDSDGDLDLVTAQSSLIEGVPVCQVCFGAFKVVSTAFHEILI